MNRARPQSPRRAVRSEFLQLTDAAVASRPKALLISKYPQLRGTHSRAGDTPRAGMIGRFLGVDYLEVAVAAHTPTMGRAARRTAVQRPGDR